MYMVAIKISIFLSGSANILAMLHVMYHSTTAFPDLHLHLLKGKANYNQLGLLPIRISQFYASKIIGIEQLVLPPHA